MGLNSTRKARFCPPGLRAEIDLTNRIQAYIFSRKSLTLHQYQSYRNMKKILVITLSAAAFFAVSNTNAQNTAYPVAVESPAGLPYTTVKVYLTVDKETVRTGPYARYAQKYLGVTAPLADRETYTIKEARLDYTDPERTDRQVAIQEPREAMSSHVDGGSEFPKATPDRMSTIDKTTEEMARDAASAIYTLRKRRFDLVTGEAGENVYGTGMKAAIEEMSRLENEYLALFLGKQSTLTTVHECDVIPQAGKTNYIVCRFTPASGIVPEGDLSAKPVVLAMTPDNSVAQAPAPAKGSSDKRPTQLYRVANITDCKLSYESTELAHKRLPILQFGQTVPGAVLAK